MRTALTGRAGEYPCRGAGRCGALWALPSERSQHSPVSPAWATASRDDPSLPVFLETSKLAIRSPEIKPVQNTGKRVESSFSCIVTRRRKKIKGQLCHWSCLTAHVWWTQNLNRKELDAILGVACPLQVWSKSMKKERSDWLPLPPSMNHPGVLNEPESESSWGCPFVW